MTVTAIQIGLDPDVIDYSSADFAQFPGLSTSRDAAIASLAGRFARTNAVVKVAYGAEAGLFHEYLNVPTVICGPGFIDQAHKPDEFIALKQIEQCERFVDGVIQYAGGSA